MTILPTKRSSGGNNEETKESGQQTVCSVVFITGIFCQSMLPVDISLLNDCRSFLFCSGCHGYICFRTMQNVLCVEETTIVYLR